MARRLRLNYVCDRCYTEAPPYIWSEWGDTIYDPPEDWKRFGKQIFCPECYVQMYREGLQAVREDDMKIRSETKRGLFEDKILEIMPKINRELLSKFADSLTDEEIDNLVEDID